jgi:hypothetical protein
MPNTVRQNIKLAIPAGDEEVIVGVGLEGGFGAGSSALQQSHRKEQQHGAHDD